MNEVMDEAEVQKALDSYRDVKLARGYLPGKGKGRPIHFRQRQGQRWWQGTHPDWTVELENPLLKALTGQSLGTRMSRFVTSGATHMLSLFGRFQGPENTATQSGTSLSFQQGLPLSQAKGGADAIFEAERSDVGAHMQRQLGTPGFAGLLLGRVIHFRALFPPTAWRTTMQR